MKVSITVKIKIWTAVHRSGGGVVISHAPPIRDQSASDLRPLAVEMNVVHLATISCWETSLDADHQPRCPCRTGTSLPWSLCWSPSRTVCAATPQRLFRNRQRDVTKSWRGPPELKMPHSHDSGFPLEHGAVAMLGVSHCICQGAQSSGWLVFVPTWYWQFCLASVTFHPLVRDKQRRMFSLCNPACSHAAWNHYLDMNF